MAMASSFWMLSSRLLQQVCDRPWRNPSRPIWSWRLRGLHARFPIRCFSAKLGSDGFGYLLATLASNISASDAEGLVSVSVSAS